MKGLEQLMSQLGARVMDDPAFMSSVLKRYLAIEGLDQEALQEELGITSELFNRLSMCKRPQRDSLRFADEIEAISDYTLVDTTALLCIIREVDSFEALRNVEGSEDYPEKLAAESPVMLAAALDRIEKPKETDESGRDEPDNE